MLSLSLKSDLRFSASVYIERNFHILKCSPPSPTRICEKNTGPRDSSLIINDNMNSSGDNNRIKPPDAMTSIARLRKLLLRQRALTKRALNPRRIPVTTCFCFTIGALCEATRLLFILPVSRRAAGWVISAFCFITLYTNTKLPIQ